MRSVPLGTICDINPAKPRNLNPESLCSFVPMEYVDDRSGTITDRATRRVAEVESGYTSFQDGDVLFAKITPCMENGKCAIARNLLGGIGFGSTEFHVLRAKPATIPAWVYYYLRQDSTRREAARHMTGSAGQKRVPSRFLDETIIPLPPLPEQQRIAGILARADRLRRLRRYALELSEGILQAVFVEMFGAELEYKGATVPLGELVTITGGGTPSRDIARYYEGPIPWLTSKDMRGDYILDTQEHITEEAIRKSAAKLVPAGSILVVVKSKVLMHTLPVAVARVPLCHGQDIKSIQCSEKVDSLFAVQVLKYHEPRLLLQARGANTEGLTLPMLRELPVPNVSLQRQREFSQVVRKHERLRAQQREAERQAEHLFQTLLGRAFRGEL